MTSDVVSDLTWKKPSDFVDKHASEPEMQREVADDLKKCGVTIALEVVDPADLPDQPVRAWRVSFRRTVDGETQVASRLYTLETDRDLTAVDLERQPGEEVMDWYLCGATNSCFLRDRRQFKKYEDVSDPALLKSVRESLAVVTLAFPALDTKARAVRF